MKKSTVLYFILLAFALGMSARASHIEETITLKAGWNAVYVESTPENPDLDILFGESPVESIGAYVSDAYDDTEQYNDDGSERNQKPVSYKFWHNEGRSTLTDLEGGRVYLIKATNSFSKSFFGIPVAPRFTWRKVSPTDTEAIINLVGVSLPAGVQTYASTYLKEGPYGAKGTLYTISGTGDAPTFKAAFNSASAKVNAGQAYGATATSSGSWPGVIELKSSSVRGGVYFEADENKASVVLTNRSTTNRIFRITYAKSAKTDEPLLPLRREVANATALGTSWTNVTADASWTCEIAAGEAQELVFGIARHELDATKNYGGVLSVEDLGGTQMRVRVPVRVAFPAAESAEVVYPTGLWLGKFQFSAVTYNGGTKPLAAEGILKPTVMFFVDKDKQMTMLQRVSVVQDTNGTTRVFKKFEDAKAVSESARRITSLMLDPANQVVAAKSGTFDGEVTFDYTVAAKSAGNPFYHAWHPDHNGLNATYSGETNEGTELWSVVNSIILQFRDLGSGSAYYSSDVDEIRAGRVLWQVDGLRSEPITAEGIFSIQRLLPISTLE